MELVSWYDKEKLKISLFFSFPRYATFEAYIRAGNPFLTLLHLWFQIHPHLNFLYISIAPSYSPMHTTTFGEIQYRPDMASYGCCDWTIIVQGRGCLGLSQPGTMQCWLSGLATLTLTSIYFIFDFHPWKHYSLHWILAWNYLTYLGVKSTGLPDWTSFSRAKKVGNPWFNVLSGSRLENRKDKEKPTLYVHERKLSQKCLITARKNGPHSPTSFFLPFLLNLFLSKVLKKVDVTFMTCS